MIYDLHGGLGNKVNHLLNGLIRGVSRFNWIIDTYSGAEWEDLFTFESIDLKILNTKRRSRSAYYDWFFRHPEKVDEAAHYLTMIKPSILVRRHMFPLPINTIGHSARLRHGKQVEPFPPFIIHEIGFLTTDCAEMRRLNCHMLQSQAFGGLHDLDPILRNREGTIRSTADWFTLLCCERLVNHGRTFTGFTTPHSTYLDAHRISGKTISDGVIF